MHGGDIYSDPIRSDFSVNLNPLGPPGDVLAAVRDSADRTVFYPDLQERALKAAIGEHYGVNPSRIACGNGASELILAVFRMLPRHPKVVLTSPCFTGYEYAAERTGAEIIRQKTEEKNGFLPGPELERLIEDVRPDLVVLSNPENPSGALCTKEQMQSILSSCRKAGSLFLADECFLELSDASQHISMTEFCRDGMESGNTLIVLNAVTKSFAVPGVRLGYAFCESSALQRSLSFELPEWNISAAAEAAGCAAMKEDPSYLKTAAALIEKEREYLSSSLTHLGYRVCRSRAPFLLFHGEDPDLFRKMKKQGILIRDCSDYDGLGPGWYRIAVRTHRQNTVLLSALEACPGSMEEL